MDREASIRHYKENLTQIKIYTETKNSQSKKYERTVSFNLHLKNILLYRYILYKHIGYSSFWSYDFAMVPLNDLRDLKYVSIMITFFYILYASNNASNGFAVLQHVYTTRSDAFFY